MATLQEEAPAAPTLALRHQARINHKDSLSTANLVRDTALTMVQHLRALHRSLALTTRLVETSRMDNNPTVDHNKADMEATSSSQTPMADLLNSTVAMTKAVTVALAVLVVTTSSRAATANLKEDMVDTRLLLEATEAEDTSNSMATAVTEDDYCLLGYRNMTCFLRWRKFDDCT